MLVDADGNLGTFRYRFKITDISNDADKLEDTLGIWWTDAHPCLKEGAASGIVAGDSEGIAIDLGGYEDSTIPPVEVFELIDGYATYQMYYDTLLRNSEGFAALTPGVERTFSDGNTYRFEGWEFPLDMSQPIDRDDLTDTYTYVDDYTGLTLVFKVITLKAQWTLVSEGEPEPESVLSFNYDPIAGSYDASAVMSAAVNNLDAFFGKLPTSDLYLNVTMLSSLPEAQRQAIAANGGTLINAFDVALVTFDDEVVPVTTDDGLTFDVRVKLTDEMSAAGAENLVLYAVADDGTTGAVEFTVEDGYLCFTINHLGTFAVMTPVSQAAATTSTTTVTTTTTTKEADDGSALPATGDPSLVVALAASGAACASFAGAAIARHKRR